MGTGTGIAPFRAFIKHIYKNVKDWQGKILLFYGAHSGLELLYMNDKNNDGTFLMIMMTMEAVAAVAVVI